jgi:hypothetical protein
MKRVKLALVCVWLSGCSPTVTTMGNQLVALETAASVQGKIIEGTTTKADIVRLYGETDAKGYEWGLEWWSYFGMRTVTGAGATERKSGGLMIRFNKEGVVQSYTMSGTKF